MRGEPKTLGEALEREMGHLHLMYPTTMTAAEHEAMKRAEREHAPGVACRINPNTFRVEYYNEKTGEIVSSHY